MTKSGVAPLDVPLVSLRGGETWPAVGLGTWRLGESRSARTREVDAVGTAIATGYRLIDTAEMYGDGGAEEVVGAAVAASIAAGVVKREQLVVVSKFYPHHAGREEMRSACRRSLDRLRLEHLDAYLLHWRGVVPLSETVAGLEALRADGLIRHWGVSNFDVDDMEALFSVPAGERCAINQIYYSISTRGPSFDLIPWHARHGVATMAYSPIEQGALSTRSELAAIAKRHEATPAQIAIAWLTRQPGVVAIPKSVSAARQRENLNAPKRVALDDGDLAAVDAVFPPPRRKTALATT